MSGRRKLTRLAAIKRVNWFAHYAPLIARLQRLRDTMFRPGPTLQWPSREREPMPSAPLVCDVDYASLERRAMRALSTEQMLVYARGENKRR